MNKTLLQFMLSFLIIQPCLSQQSTENVIRSLENEERLAILNKDTVKLSALMSPDIAVQNPENAIVTYRQIISRVNSGQINYSSFDRQIEKITFNGDIAIVMGKELINNASDPSKTITRRFTNIWMKKRLGWVLVARPATIV